MTLKTDKEWKKFGKKYPYFAVLTDEKYLPENLTPQNLQEFFESGRHLAEETIEWVNSEIPNFSPKRLLDFGCGTGRLTIPFSIYAEEVVGADVSEDMLSIAQKNSLKFNRSNVAFIMTDELYKDEIERFDLIFSYNVFQHIEVKDGEQILNHLISLLRPGGVIILHLTYFYTKESQVQRIASFLRKKFSIINKLLNIRLGKPSNFPLMLMNNYDLNRIFRILQEEEMEILSVRSTNHDGHLGLVFMGRI